MNRLNPAKLHVNLSTGSAVDLLNLLRRYTVTHSDSTGDLFLTIGSDYEKKQVSGLYTRLMRDEVRAELIGIDNHRELKVYCHVSGGLVFGSAKWRSKIFHSELPLVLEVIRYGDRTLFDINPFLDRVPVNVYFQSHNRQYNQVENWGVIEDYK
jgi:hypothetical protein